MKNKASIIPFAIVGFVVVLGCGRFSQQLNKSTETKPASDSSEFTLAGKEWKTFELEQMEMIVDLPGQPIDKTPPDAMLPAGYKEVFSSMKIHAYDEKDFASSYTQLGLTGKKSLDIKQLGDTSMASLKRQLRDLTYTLEIQSPTNAKYDGTFTRNGKTYEVKGCCVLNKAKPSKVWAVITLFPTDSTDGRSASQRIIDSVMFGGSEEKCK